MNYHMRKITRAIVDALGDSTMTRLDLIDLFTLLHVSITNVLTYLLSLGQKRLDENDRDDATNKFSMN